MRPRSCPQKLFNSTREQAKSQLSHLTVGHDPEASAQCDMLIEAVFEDYEVKRALFKTVGPHLKPGTPWRPLCYLLFKLCAAGLET
jgi:3-hydroxyacyl-CoA dehydrogenase